MLDKTKNYKIDVSALSTAEEIKLQEELFKQGYKWHMVGKEIQSSAYKYYFLYDNGDITHSDKYFFDKSDHTLITVSDIMPQTEEDAEGLVCWASTVWIDGYVPLSDIQVAKRSFEYADTMMKERATHSTHSVPPSDSKTDKVYGVVDAPENAVQPVFHIGDKIRYKSTGTIEKVHYITGGGKFINSVSVEDVELVKEK